MHRRLTLALNAIAVVTTLSSPFSLPAAAEAAEPEPGTIVTVAGTGKPNYSGDGGPATKAALASPDGIALDGAGNLFIADGGNLRVRKVDTNGIITTVAGTGTAGFSGDGGPARKAQLNEAWGVVVDGAGNLYIADGNNQRVRKVTPDGIITTVAGSGPTGANKGGYSGDGGPATEARLNFPTGLAVDAAGNLYIADRGNNRVRKLDKAGNITTMAGTGVAGSSGDGGPATSARISLVSAGLAVDGAGNLYIPDGSNRIRKVGADGIITTVAGRGSAGFSGDGGLATEARLNLPADAAVDSEGNLFIADYLNGRVRKVDKGGIISTVAGNGTLRYPGDGGLATAAGLNGPYHLAIDAAGNLLLSNLNTIGDNQRVLKVFGVAAPGLLAGMPFPKP